MPKKGSMPPMVCIQKGATLGEVSAKRGLGAKRESFYQIDSFDSSTP